MTKKTLTFILVLLILFSISIFVISKIVWNDQLIGRSIDFPVPPVDYMNKNVFLSNFYQWNGMANGGSRSTFSATLIPVNAILYLPVLFGAGSWFIARYQIILSLFLAMGFFYLLAKRILEGYELEERVGTILSILGAIFFTLNNYFFCEIIFGSNVIYFTFSFVPLFLYAILSYYQTASKKRYLILALFSLIIISSTMQHLVLAYVLLVTMAIIYRDIKLFIILALAHFGLSLYWIIPLLYTIPSIKGVEMSIITDWTFNLTVSASNFLNTLINREYFFNRNTYAVALRSSTLVTIWIFNAYLLLVTSLACLLKLDFFKKEHKKIILWFSSLFILSLLFIKGAHEPFGNSVLFLYNNFPLFSMFRSLQHYISFYVIAISILFIFSGLFLLKKNKKYLFLLIVLIYFNTMPWWLTRDLGTKNILSVNYLPSYLGQFYLTEGNEKMYALSKLPLDFAIMHIPPGFSLNFLAVGKNEFDYIIGGTKKIKSQGGDTGLYYGTKKFYTTASSANTFPLVPVLDDLEKSMYTDKDFFNIQKNIFSILNIRYFALREDIAPLFSKNASLLNINNVKEAIAESKIFGGQQQFDYITIIKNDYFLPHFYTAENIITTNQSITALPQIVAEPNYKIRSVLYFEEQNKNINNDVLLQMKQSNLKQQIVPETKLDKLKALTEKIKAVTSNLTYFKEKKFEELSKIDRQILIDLKSSKQKFDEEQASLQSNPAQFFADINEDGIYNLSFKLGLCRNGKLQKPNDPLSISINGAYYNVAKDIKTQKLNIDVNCFINIKNIKLAKGSIEITTNNALDIANLIFSNEHINTSETPTIEFKKVSPVKYRVVVHQAKNNFPLIFSENHSPAWKAYLGGGYKARIDEPTSPDVKLPNDNIDDQASKEELELYRNNKWLTNLGDTPAFVSKNFQGTIQNNNLPNGHSYETWFKKPLAESSHLIANGYANSWWIDLEKVCGNQANKSISNCVKNPDGSYDFEVVIEFWPQRLFTIGLLISGFLLLGYIGFRGYKWQNNRQVQPRL